MLDLQSGVHLEEEELAVLVEELDGPGVDVAAGLGHPHGGGAHGLTNVVREGGGRALLDELLVATLGRAVALAEPDGVTLAVGDDLHLDVAWPGQVSLDVALACGRSRRSTPRMADSRAAAASSAEATTFMPAAPAAEGSLDGNRPAVLLAEGDDLVRRLEDLGPAGHPGDPGSLGRMSRALILSPMTSMASGGGPTKTTPFSVMARAKSVFSEKKP